MVVVASSIRLLPLLALVLAILSAGDGPQFLPPSPISELNTACREKGPWISGDGLRLYFTSDRANGSGGTVAMDIWRSSRKSVDELFENPEIVWVDGGDPSLSADELTLYFVRVANGGPSARPNLDLFVSHRPSIDAAFSEAEPVVEANTPFNEVGPSLATDGRRLYFASDRPGGLGGYDLWCCERESDGDLFAPPRDLVEVNSEAAEANPAVTGDGLSLCFASDREGSRGLDLYWASRTSPDDPFEEPVNLVALNSPRLDKAPALTCDGRLLVFRSTRDGGAGLSDLYVTRRNPSPSRRDSGMSVPLLERDDMPEIQIQTLRMRLPQDPSRDPLPWVARVFVDPDRLPSGHVPEWEQFRLYVGLINDDPSCGEERDPPDAAYEEAPLVSVELTDADGTPTPDPEGLWFRKIRFEPPAQVRERLADASRGRAPLVSIRAEVRIVGHGVGSGIHERRVRSDVAIALDAKAANADVFHAQRPLALQWVKPKRQQPNQWPAELRLAGTGFLRDVASVVTFEDDRGDAVATARGIVLNEFMMQCPLPDALAARAGPWRIRVSNGPREVALHVDSIAGS